jgi:hypothetical protein
MSVRLGFPEQPQGGQCPLPMVYVRDTPGWEYKRMVRDLPGEEAPVKTELEALGAEGWELAGMGSSEHVVYLFYFKRLAT